MFTDLVGYTSLSQKNEALALRLLGHLEEVLRPIFRKHNGEEIKTMGDAFLVEFASALEAVKCARAVQESLHELNSALPLEQRMMVRVGIHVGDVIHARGDVFGDAVNVASRIESITEPGGICITQQVFDHVRNKADMPAVYLGKQELKNVELPVDVYRVLLPWESKLAQPALSASSHRIVVLPLTNISPDPSDEYFADGLTEELISTVSKIADLKVISRTSAMKYKGLSKSVGEIARELNVGAVLEGSVRKAGNRLRITVQLVEVRRDEHLWSQTYDRELEDVFAIQGDIAQRVAEALEVHLLAREKRRIERKATSNIEAYTLYLKGLHYRGERTEEGLRKAILYFEEALQKDPKFGFAYAGLADCYAQLGDDGILPSKESFPKAKALALRALQLDDTIAEAHAILGGVLEDYYLDLSGAEREFERSIGLNPNYGRVCHCYGVHLACTGRLDQAITEIRKAQEVNPLALDVNDCAANIFIWANHYDEALETCQTMLRIDQDYFPAYQDLAEAYLQKSMFGDAIAALQKAVKLSKGSPSARSRLGYAYGLSGKAGKARKILDGLKEHSKERHVSPISIAMVHLGLGDKEKTLKMLEKACKDRDGGLLGIKYNPVWSGLRSEPRFIAIMNRMGLPS